MEIQANTTPEFVPKQRRWFIVLLILFGLAGVIIALLIPAVDAARERAVRLQCPNNIKQLCFAFHSYHNVHGSFPPAYTVDDDGKPLHSWRVLILPYIDQRELYDKIRLNEPWDSEYNQQFHDIQMKVFQCSSSPRRVSLVRKIRNVVVKNDELRRMANCDYSVVIGEGTFFSSSKEITLDGIADGIDNTILIVERMVPVNWMDPNNEIRFEVARVGVNRNLFGIGSKHGRMGTFGAFVGFANGYVEFLPDDFENIESLLTKSAGD
jgi:hypothetical protein